MPTSTPGETSDVLSGVQLPSVSGSAAAVVLAAQAADSATTLYGLRTHGVRERNPILAVLVEQIGPVLGLLLGNVLALGLLVTSVELGAQYCREHAVSETRVRLFRACSYATFAVLSFAAAVHNLRVLAAV